MKAKTTVKAGIIWGLAQGASAVDPGTIIASVLCGLVPQVILLARALAVLMFVYGGAKYAYGADDPGARKQGKSIAINGLIGFIIVAMSKALIENIAGLTIC